LTGERERGKELGRRNREGKGVVKGRGEKKIRR
jgi:hypothetical protein